MEGTFENLPKYDATGVLYEYRVKEVSMTVDGMTTGAVIENGSATVTGTDRTYHYTCTIQAEAPQLAQEQWTPGSGEPSPHHSGDVYPWTATNKRENTQDIVVKKIWRDGAGPNNSQDPVVRPDISFHIYRISHADLKSKAPGTEDNFAGALNDLIQTETQAQAMAERVNRNYFWNTSLEDTETGDARPLNMWYWECDVYNDAPLYDENGSPYIYFAFEYMRGNAYGYKAEYENNKAHVDGQIHPEAGTTKGTFEHSLDEHSNFLLIVDGENPNDYYPCVVVNTRESAASITGAKTWNFGKSGLQLGSDIEYQDLPNVKLRLWRDVAKMEPSAQSGGKATKDTSYTFVPAKWENATEIDSLTLGYLDEQENKPSDQWPDGYASTRVYKYSFPSAAYRGGDLLNGNLPRYDEYGYRYSYWITEEPIDGYTSDNIGKPAGEPNGKPQFDETFSESKRGQFDITNTYKGSPPNVRIDLTKTWEWPADLPDDKKNLTVTFELWGYISERDGKKIGEERFARASISVTNGTADKEGISFTQSNIGPFAGEDLPYYSPAGTPYLWYIKESKTDGYEVTSEITMDANNPAPGGLITAVKSFFSKLTGREAANAAKSTELYSAVIRPSIDDNPALATANITFNNKYVGNPRKLNVQKSWADQFLNTEGTLTELRQDVQVKLYRQWSIASGKTAWEQVTGPDENAADASGWDQMGNGILTLTKENSWTLAEPLTNLYQYAPNGRIYQYFVVEQGSGLDEWYAASTSADNHPDVGNGQKGEINTWEMQKREKYSDSVTLPDDETQAAAASLTNTLRTKQLSVTKDWEKQVDGGTDTFRLSGQEAQELKDLGILPKTVSFVVQYRLGDSGDWYLMPKDAAKFGKDGGKESLTAITSAADLENYCHVSNSIDSLIDWANTHTDTGMHSTRTVEDLPARYKDGAGQMVEVSYRWVEVMQWQNGAGTTLDIRNPENEETKKDIISTPGTVAAKPGTTPVSPDTAVLTQTFTNTIPVKRLVLRKIWLNDHGNRDDTRPESITIHVDQVKSGAAVGDGFDVVLTRDNMTAWGSYESDDVYQSPVHYVPAALIRDGSGTTLEADLAATEVRCPEGYVQVKSDTDQEAAPADYGLPFAKETDNAGNDIYVFTAANKLKKPEDDTEREKITLTAKKQWEGDSGWEALTRPTVKFRLEYLDAGDGSWKTVTKDYNNVEDSTKEVSAEGGYSVSWEDVFKYHTEDGTAVAREIQYRVVEVMEDGSGRELSTKPYTSAGSAEFDKTNYQAEIKNTLKTVRPSVKKLWSYSSIDTGAAGALSAAQLGVLISEGVLPSAVRFELYYSCNGGTSWTQYMTETDSGKMPFTLELSVADQLLKDNVPQLYTMTQSFPQFDKFGSEILYELRESGVCFGGVCQEVENGQVGSFTVSGTRTDAASTEVTNTLKVGSLTVTKTWDDMLNRDGLRTAVEVQLSRDGAPYGEKVTLTGTNGWTHTWNDLPLYKTGSGSELSVYQVEESPVAHYSADPGMVESLTVDQHVYAELVNRYQPKVISVSAQKVWDDQDNFYGLRPETILLQLQVSRDYGRTWENVPYSPSGFTGSSDVSFREVSGGTLDGNGRVEVRETADGWPVVTWKGLPAKAGGVLLQYKVIEPEVPAYYTGTASQPLSDPVPEAPVSVTNTLSKTRITVEKKWNDQENRYGTRPDSLTFRLQSRGPGGEWTDEGSITIKEPWDPITIEDLPARDDSGKLLEYQVVENVPNGYTVSGPAHPSAYRNVLTNRLDTVGITVTKKWNDQDNRYHIRPDNLELTVSYLGADGEQIPLESQPEFTWSKQDNTWTAELTGLPKYVPGTATEAYYIVKEKVPTGYQAVSSQAQVTGGAAELTNTLDSLSLTLEKRWWWSKDVETAPLTAEQIQSMLDTGVLPAFIRFEVERQIEDGAWQPEETLVLSVRNDLLSSAYAAQTYTVPHEYPRYTADGKTVFYRIRETGVSYGGEDAMIPVEDTAFAVRSDSESTHTTVTNTLPVGSLTVAKTWEDMNDRYGLRTAVEVQLSRDGVPYGGKVTLTEANGWTYTWDDLPVYQTGKRVLSKYTVTEKLVDPYETVTGTVSDLTIEQASRAELINRYRPEGISVSAQKVWDDQDNFYGLRPASVLLQLQYRLDGTDTWQNVSCNPSGFQSSQQDNAEVSFQKVTLNTGSGKTAVPDGENRVEVRGEDGWPTVTWHNLPAMAEGKRLYYRVVEPELDSHYSCAAAPAETAAPDSGDPETITVKNTLRTVDIRVEKDWDDQGDRYGTRPDSLTFQLQAKIAGGAWKTVLDKDGNPLTRTMDRPTDPNASWEPVTFDKLLARDEDGHILFYRVVEACPAGYVSPAYEEDLPDGTPEAPILVEPNQSVASLTNRLATVSITVTKTWEDQSNHYNTRPDNLELTVGYQGEDGKIILLKSQPVFTWSKQGDTWTAELTGLPKYVPGTNTEAVYTVTETVPTGYRAENPAVQAAEGKAGLTNKLETVDLAGTKTWDDADNQDGVRPTEITVYLFADGETLAEHTRTVGQEDWSWTFRGLPKYRKDGTEVVYTVQEKAVDGYTARIDGMDIVNTHIPEQVSVSVEKSWKDWLNADRIRPDTIVVHLLADDADTGKTLTLGEENQWRGSFDGLDKYRKGVEIVYTIKEDPVKGYTTSITGSAQDGFVVENLHRPNFLLPKTGDDSNLALYGAVLLLAGGGITGLLLYWGKRKKKNT